MLLEKIALVLGIILSIMGAACGVLDGAQRDPGYEMGQNIDELLNSANKTYTAVTGKETEAPWGNMGVGLGVGGVLSGLVGLYRVFRGNKVEVEKALVEQRSQLERELQIAHARINKAKEEVDELWDKSAAK